MGDFFLWAKLFFFWKKKFFFRKKISGEKVFFVLKKKLEKTLSRKKIIFLKIFGFFCGRFFFVGENFFEKKYLFVGKKFFF